MIPRFNRGEVLTADKLNQMGDRVRQMQGQMHGRCDHNTHTTRHAWARQRLTPAFQLMNRRGVLYYAQGFVDGGHGQLVPVGAAGWNCLGVGCMEPVDVWLDITAESGAVTAAEVVTAPRDAAAVSTRLHIRLGYVEVTDGRYRLMQLAGGLINPWQPVMARGTCKTRSDDDTPYVAGGDPKFWGRHDCCNAMHTAGALAGEGYKLTPESTGKLRNEFTLGYTLELTAGSYGGTVTANSGRYLQLDGPWRE